MQGNDALISTGPYLGSNVSWLSVLNSYGILIHKFKICRTRKDMILPLSRPIPGSIKDGNPIHEVHIKNNTKVIVSILAANRNKDVWGEDAEEWKPERWLSPLPDSVAKAHLPGVYASM